MSETFPTARERMAIAKSIADKGRDFPEAGEAMLRAIVTEFIVRAYERLAGKVRLATGERLI